MTVSDEMAVELLRDLVRTPSLCGQEDRVAAVLLQALEATGFEAGRDEVGNVIGHIGPRDANRSVVILGHMDTVPGVVPVEVRDGILYGRGTVDAKGPLAAGTVAAARVTATANLAVTVVGAVQEEGPSAGARHLAGQNPPTYLVIAEPSGSDAVVLGYKGSQRFTVELRQPVAHTAGAQPPVAERLIDFWNRLTIWCSDAAAATGERQSLSVQPAGSPPSAPPRAKSTAIFDRLTATLIAMSSSSDGLDECASLQIGLRLPPGITLETVRTGVQALLPAGTFRFSPGEPAVRGGKSNPLVAAFVRAIRAEGDAPRFKLKTGTSDMNVVGPIWRCPMVAYGPGDSALDHTPEEHVELTEYLRGIRVLTRVLAEL